MTDTTQTWLLRLQALTVAERPALLREMSRHEVEAVVLRLMAQLEGLERDVLEHCREGVAPYRKRARRSWWVRIWEGRGR